MSKISINDWQTIQTRKDVQILRRTLNNTSITDWSILIDLTLLIIGFSLDNIFGEQASKPSTMWVVISGLAIILPVIIILFQLIHKRQVAKSSKQVKWTGSLVDLFDNEVCYNIMTADSLFENAQDCDAKFAADKKPIRRFYYIEASYYTNKAVDQLFIMRNTLRHVIKDKESNGKTISIMRFVNVLMIIHDIYDHMQKQLKSENGMNDILNHNSEYIRLYNAIVSEANNVFPTHISKELCITL